MGSVKVIPSSGEGVANRISLIVFHGILLWRGLASLFSVMAGFEAIRSSLDAIHTAD